MIVPKCKEVILIKSNSDKSIISSQISQEIIKTNQLFFNRLADLLLPIKHPFKRINSQSMPIVQNFSSTCSFHVSVYNFVAIRLGIFFLNFYIFSNKMPKGKAASQLILYYCEQILCSLKCNLLTFETVLFHFSIYFCHFVCTFTCSTHFIANDKKNKH